MIVLMLRLAEGREPMSFFNGSAEQRASSL